MGIDLSTLTKEIKLKRTGVVFNKNNVIGKRGQLTAGATTLETIERGGNYVSLPAGRFLLTMTKDKNRGQVFIVQPDGKFGHKVPTLDGDIAGIMIHSADTPDDLTGCLAPGRSFDATSGTLQKSTEAMTDIFNYFGGFGETKLAGWIVVE